MRPRNSRHQHQIIPRRPLSVSPLGSLPRGLQGVQYSNEEIPNVPTSSGNDLPIFNDADIGREVHWVIVAAADAPDSWRAVADYQCDGLLDTATIHDARNEIHSLPDNIGDIEDPDGRYYSAVGLLLSPGTFNLEIMLQLWDIPIISGVYGSTVLVRQFNSNSAMVSYNAASFTAGSYAEADGGIMQNIIFNGNYVYFRQTLGVDDAWSYDIMHASGSNGPMIFEGCSFVNSGDVGIYSSFSTVIIRNCKFEYCPIGIYMDGTRPRNSALVEGCHFAYNETSIYTGINAMVRDCVFRYDGIYSGGQYEWEFNTFGSMGIVTDVGFLQVKDCKFYDNYYMDGAIVVYDTEFRIDGCTFDHQPNPSDLDKDTHTLILVDSPYRGAIQNCHFDVNFISNQDNNVIKLINPYDVTITQNNMFVGSGPNIAAIYMTDEGFPFGGTPEDFPTITINEITLDGSDGVGSVAIKSDMPAQLRAYNINIRNFETKYSLTGGTRLTPSNFYSGITFEEVSNMILISPDGSRFYIGVNNDGTLVTWKADANVSMVDKESAMTIVAERIAVGIASIASTGSQLTVAEVESSGVIAMASTGTLTATGIDSPTVTMTSTATTIGTAGVESFGSTTNNGVATLVATAL